MTTYTIRQVYQLARNAGLSDLNAIYATMIAMAESGLRTDAVGDTSLADRTWGPSIGLWQIRSVNAEKGKGTTRDASKLRDPAFNAASMAKISNGGKNFNAWSTYTNATFEKYYESVRKAINSAPAAPTPRSKVVRTDWGDALPDIPHVPDPSDLLDGGEELLDGVSDGALGVAQGVVGLLVKAMAPAVLIGAGVIGGFAIIAIGLWRGMEDDE